MKRHPAKNPRRQHLLGAALVVALATTAVANIGYAQEAVDKRRFEIPAQPAAAALNRFAQQADITLVFSQDAVAGVEARPLAGSFTTQQGLAALLQGTGLSWQTIDGSTVSITRGQQPLSLDTIVVTGTHIRGGETPSPVISIDAARIREEGFTDLGEVIRSVPQNYSGGQNPGVVNGQAGNVANANITGGSSLNLRGLGPDATLTLLNGRRLAYGGLYQSVDISAIPIEAVERVEIVADGASAIYGSDAVGGVGNVILKRDFNGIGVGARYGLATEGGMTTREYSATAGVTWSGGGLLTTYRDASLDPLFADQRDYTGHLSKPFSIYPGSEVRSGLLSVFHTFGDAVELRVDGFKTEREQLAYGSRPTFVNISTPETESSMISPSVKVSLWGGWTLLAGAGWGKDDVLSYGVMTTFATGVSNVVANTAYANENLTYDVGAEGPLFSLGGGDARLAVGAGHRKHEFYQLNKMTNVASSVGDDNSRFAYAEIDLPLIGADSKVAAVRKLSLTAAVRGEDYGSVGQVTTPKFGVIYGPSADVTLKASWGKSFKAPTLVQRYGPQWAYHERPSYYGGTGYPSGAMVLEATGSNSDLGPERARTWTASLEFHPQALPRLEAQLSVFDIDYTNRVVIPISSPTQGLSNPIYAPFITYSPTVEQQAAILASAGSFNLGGVPYDANNIVAIVDGRYANATAQRIKGIDVSGGYGFDFGSSRLTIRGSASWLDSSQITTPNRPAFDLSGTIYNPARSKSRIGAVWNRGGFTAGGFGNYTGGVINAVAAEKTASFTTFDATVRYRTAEHAGAWSGLDFSLSAQNLFDREPPGHTSASVIAVHYDSTNYSPIGRFLSASISKQW